MRMHRFTLAVLAAVSWAASPRAAGGDGKDLLNVGDNLVEKAMEKKDHVVVKIEKKGDLPTFKAMEKSQVDAYIASVREEDKDAKKAWSKTKEGEKPAPRKVSIADGTLRTAEDAQKKAEELREKAEEKEARKKKKD